jgi:recombination protein RecA
LIHSNICSIIRGMAALSPDVTAALTTLRSKWGAAASSDRWLAGASPRSSEGGLALALEVADAPKPDSSRIFSTGFADLDAILGPGGLPRGLGLSLRGDLSSGRTTLALRLVAEAQAAGSIAAWLDLAAALDPVEAVARGVRPEWLVVLTPADAEEGLAMAGSLLAGRTVDLLVIDLPPRLEGAARVADRLGRLAALARRAGISLVVLEPPGLVSGVAAAVGEATGIRLELARRSWLRLGRDVVGQRTEVLIARSRAGPPGRRTTLRILYADGGERDACLRREDLLNSRPVQPADINAPVPVPGRRNHATAASLSTASPPRPREATPALRLVAGGADRPRREAVVGRDRHGRGSRGPGARRPTGDPARVGPPARAGGDVPGSRAGG